MKKNKLIIISVIIMLLLIGAMVLLRLSIQQEILLIHMGKQGNIKLVFRGNIMECIYGIIMLNKRIN